MTPAPTPVEAEPVQDELREEQMNDPAVRVRLRQIFEEARKGAQRPGITAEELPDFLREHGHGVLYAIPDPEARMVAAADIRTSH